MQQAVYSHATISKAHPQPDFSGWVLRSTTILYLSAMIAVPVFVVFCSGFQGGLIAFWGNITQPQALSALIIFTGAYFLPLPKNLRVFPDSSEITCKRAVSCSTAINARYVHCFHLLPNTIV